MDFPAVLAVLNDLPPTFKRSGAPYTQLMDSIATALLRFTLGEDFTVSQATSFGNAIDGWLDFWGLLWGVPRNDGEGNIPYALRIERTVLAAVGTLPAIQAWISFYAFGGTVFENASGLGYQITLPATMSQTQVDFFIKSLGRIRPIGVPFNITLIGAGIYLGTEEFLGTGTVMGSYVTTGGDALTLSLSSTTPNSPPLLPTLLLTDPTINTRTVPFSSLVPGSQGNLPGILPPSHATPPTPASSPFWSNSGVLSLVNPASLPTSPTGLYVGAYWSDTGEVTIVLGGMPFSAPPLYYYSVSLASLQTSNGNGLPTSNPGAGTQQLWNNGGVVCIA